MSVCLQCFYSGAELLIPLKKAQTAAEVYASSHYGIFRIETFRVEGANLFPILEDIYVANSQAKSIDAHIADTSESTRDFLRRLAEKYASRDNIYISCLVDDSV